MSGGISKNNQSFDPACYSRLPKTKLVQFTAESAKLEFSGLIGEINVEDHGHVYQVVMIPSDMRSRWCGSSKQYLLLLFFHCLK